MSSGVYNALSGARAQMRTLDIVSNNLANANTVGFKRDRISFETMLKEAGDPLASKELNFTDIAGTTIDFSQGPIQSTGGSLDLAVEGEGLFKVRGPEGIAYTRNGSFRLDAEGRLVTPAGHEVLGKKGPITLSSAEVSIADDGAVLFEGAEVARLDLYAFADSVPMEKRGDALFVPSDGSAPALLENPRIRQGALEMGNVNVVQEMARMIDSQRSFEAYQKAIKGYVGLRRADDLGSVG